MDVDNMKSATACGTSETTVPALHPPVDEDLFKPPALPTRAKPKKEKAPLKKPKKPKAPTKKERAEQALREAQAAAQARSVLSHATLRANETRRKKKRDATSTLVADVDEAKRHACVRLAELLESSDEGESAVGVDGDGQSGDDTVDLGSRHTIRLTPPFLSASNLRYNRDSFWCVSQSAIEEQQGLHGHNYQTSLLYNVTSKAEVCFSICVSDMAH